jgi:hypothetical protein
MSFTIYQVALFTLLLSTGLREAMAMDSILETHSNSTTLNLDYTDSLKFCQQQPERLMKRQSCDYGYFLCLNVDWCCYDGETCCSPDVGASCEFCSSPQKKKIGRK